jgi:hypothetical protein
MTVEGFLKDYLERMVAQATEHVDDAMDQLQLVYKQQREEIKNAVHQRRAEQAARHKAGKKRVCDLQLTVTEAGEEAEATIGTVHLICPRQRAGGMCKIGRSAGDDFKGSKGVSLPSDFGVSVWHGKVSAPS